MLGSAVGQSFSLALATMPNVGYPNDIFPSRRFYQVDMSTPEIVLSSPGVIEAPRSFGADSLRIMLSWRLHQSNPHQSASNSKPDEINLIGISVQLSIC